MDKLFYFGTHVSLYVTMPRRVKPSYVLLTYALNLEITIQVK